MDDERRHETHHASEDLTVLLERMQMRTTQSEAEDEAVNARLEAEERARTLREAERNIARWELPVRLVRELRAGFRETEAVRAVRSWLNAVPQKSSLVLCGGKGTGKSSAAAWGLIQNGAGLFCYAGELATMARDRADRQRLALAPLLVVDDLGEDYSDEKGWLASFVDTLMTRRHDNDRLTVITTNLTRPQLSERYSQRVIDRLAAGDFVALVGESLRTGRK